MHLLHSVAPEAFWYVPNEQGAHMPLPTELVKLPGRQSMHTLASVLPGTGLALPGSQARHELLLFAPRSGL